MLHGGERAPAGEGSADRDVERDLLVGRPLGVQVLGRIGAERLEDFGAGRARIGGGDLTPASQAPRAIASFPDRRSVWGAEAGRASVVVGTVTSSPCEPVQGSPVRARTARAIRL